MARPLDEPLLTPRSPDDPFGKLAELQQELDSLDPNSKAYAETKADRTAHQIFLFFRRAEAEFEDGNLETSLLYLERAEATGALSADDRRKVTQRRKHFSDVADRIALAKRLLKQKRYRESKRELKKLKVYAGRWYRNAYEREASKLLEIIDSAIGPSEDPPNADGW